MGLMVLAFGRSGTSVTTAAVAALARDAELPDDDFGARPDNPKGYFESARLSMFNDRLLRALDGPWGAPPELEPGWVTRARALPGFSAPDAQKEFATVFHTDNWVWKDPRNSIVAPYWIDLVKPRGYVMIYRNPIEVASSVTDQTKAAVDKAHGLALWERCTRASLEAAQGQPVVLVSHATLFQDPARFVADIVSFLETIDVPLTDADPRTAVDTVVDPSLHRQRAPMSDPADDPDVTPQCAALFNTMRSLEGVHCEFCPPDLGVESPSVAEILDMKRRVMLKLPS